MVCEALMPSEYQLLLEGCSLRAELRLAALKLTCEASELNFTLFDCVTPGIPCLFSGKHVAEVIIEECGKD